MLSLVMQWQRPPTRSRKRVFYLAQGASLVSLQVCASHTCTCTKLLDTLEQNRRIFSGGVQDFGRGFREISKGITGARNAFLR